jgi:hypothetical protein
MKLARSVLSCLVLFAVGTIGAGAQTSDAEAYDKYLKLTRSAPAAYRAGDKRAAAAQANELLEMATTYRKDWNYGNAVHSAHLVLGRIAADAGRMGEAKRHLMESVTSLPYTFESIKTEPWEEPFPKRPYKASPQMDTFGPDMSFAHFLLEKGEKEAVLKYLDLCGRFWKMGEERLDLWRKQINDGEVPDFGPNMVYFFPKETSQQQ